MRIFKNKWFAKFASKEGISDEKLIQAVKGGGGGTSTPIMAEAL